MNPAPVWNTAIVSNSPICAGDTISLQAPIIANVSYDWTGPNGFTATGSNVTIPNTLVFIHQGFYSVIATDNITGCISNPLSTLAIITDLPATGVAGNSGPVCAGDVAQVYATNFFGATYSWNGPNGFTSTNRTLTFNPLLADGGIYTVTVTINNCTAVYSTTLSVYPLPVITVSSDTVTTVGVPIGILAVGDISYVWTPAAYLNSANIPNPIFTPTMEGTFSLVATTYNIYGCSASDSISIQVNSFILANATIVDLITPNGDGVNDTWPVNFLPGFGGYNLQILSLIHI